MLKKIMMIAALALSAGQNFAWAEKLTAEHLQQLQEKSAAGDAGAQAQLGALYFDGSGVIQDIEKGLALLNKAADAGNSNAQLTLGFIYASGKRGVPQDLAKGIIWLEKSAAQGNDLARQALRYFRSKVQATG